MYQSIPKPPMPPLPGKPPGHLTFLKNFGQIPRYVATLDGQMRPPPPVRAPKSVKSPTLKQITIILLSSSGLKFLIQKLLSQTPAFTKAKDSRMNQCLTYVLTTSLLKHFNTRISPRVTHQELRKVSSKERP